MTFVATRTKKKISKLAMMNTNLPPLVAVTCGRGPTSVRNISTSFSPLICAISIVLKSRSYFSIVFEGKGANAIVKLMITELSGVGFGILVTSE